MWHLQMGSHFHLTFLEDACTHFFHLYTLYIVEFKLIF